MKFFGIFTKKRKSDVLERDKDESLRSTLEKLRLKLITYENEQAFAVSKTLEAKKKKLPVEEKRWRNMLGRNIVMQKRIQRMIMTIELAMHTRDMAKLNHDFVQCMGDLADDINLAAENFDTKKLEKKYTKAMFEAERQMDKIDALMDLGDDVFSVSADANAVSECEGEVEAMLREAEMSECASTIAGSHRF